MSRVIVVTGGTAGVGRAVARRFASEGDAVAVLARGREGLRATVADLGDLGGRGLGITTDVAEVDQVDAAAARIERELGPIDVWINQAMTTAVGPVARLTPGELQRITSVCYHGTVWGTCAALRYMAPRNRGTIIQVGSALAYRSIPLQAAYCGAKHAVRGFTDSVRAELAHAKVNLAVCMVQLPAVNTPHFGWCVHAMPRSAEPVPPILEPEVVAEAIYRVSLHPQREVFLDGPTIRAMVGHAHVAACADGGPATDGDAGAPTGEATAGTLVSGSEPVPGGHAAHGTFDVTARSRDRFVRIARGLGGAGVHG